MLEEFLIMAAEEGSPPTLSRGVTDLRRGLSHCRGRSGNL